MSFSILFTYSYPFSVKADVYKYIVCLMLEYAFPKWYPNSSGDA